MIKLFSPTTVGSMTLNNAIVMAPLTRSRALDGLVPGPLTVEYYRQRASAGLIIAEATQVNAMAQGYINTPGIYTEQQVSAWKKVTDSVHEAGGKMVVQLWHVGRISHSSLLPHGASPLSSSAVRANMKAYTTEGMVDVSEPKAMTTEDIQSLIVDFTQAARHAISAGFDGVEIHAANNYLLEQFLRDSVNQRDDNYGGSIENRARLVIEIARSICDAIGADKVGIRLSPMTTFNDAQPDSQAQVLYEYVVTQMSALGLAYVHIIEGETGGARTPENAPFIFDYQALKACFTGTWMINNGVTRDEAITLVDAGEADLVSFGRLFIANPDLVYRLEHKLPMNELDVNGLYGGGAEGYTDYPTVEQS
jgi:N-ethylmaleimide reductase